MAMKKIVRKYGNSAEFIVGDHFVNVKWMHAKATSVAPGFATLVGDRYIVTAGTLITDEGVPLGLVYRDVDVTDGDAMLALVVHAVVNRDALPAVLTYAQEQGLPGIVFRNGSAPEAVPADQPVYFYIDIPTVEHATITPEEGSHKIMPKGGTFAFKVAAGDGYHVTSVTANGDALEADEGVYSIEDLDADQAIAVSVAADL